MKKIYNIYCDESCHLLNDDNKVFALGAIWVEKNKTEKIFDELRALKLKHGLSAIFEAKWTKVSDSKVNYYSDLVNYFFESPHLYFRGVVVQDKSILKHSVFAQDHDTWYYKMFYVLLRPIIQGLNEYNLYLDIKDTKSNVKILELKRILNISAPSDIAITKAQQIRSHEIEIIQLVDLFAGALSYKHRKLSGNKGKIKIIKIIEKLRGEKSLLLSSTLDENKFNILIWKPKKRII